MSKKGGGPLILGMAENPSSKELVEYDEEQDKNQDKKITGGSKRKVRKTLKKKKSLKRKKSLRKRK